MAEFIPSINFTDFRKLKPDQLGRLKSCEVNFNSRYLFTFVNGNAEISGFLRKQTEYNCQTANALYGKSLEEVLGEVSAPV